MLTLPDKRGRVRVEDMWLRRQFQIRVCAALGAKLVQPALPGRAMGDSHVIGAHGAIVDKNEETPACRKCTGE